MKFFTYIDIGITKFLEWQFSSVKIAVPMILLELFLGIIIFSLIRTMFMSRNCWGGAE
jgi:hypothetical protein